MNAAKEPLLRLDRVPVRQELGLSLRIPLLQLRLVVCFHFKTLLDAVPQCPFVNIAAHFVAIIFLFDWEHGEGEDPKREI